MSPPGGEAVAGRLGRGGPQAASQAEPYRGAATVCRVPLAAWVDRMGPGGLGGSCEAHEEPGPSRTRGLAAGAKWPSPDVPRPAPVGGNRPSGGGHSPRQAQRAGFLNRTVLEGLRPQSRFVSTSSEVAVRSRVSASRRPRCSRSARCVIGLKFPPHVRHFTDRKVRAPNGGS